MVVCVTGVLLLLDRSQDHMVCCLHQQPAEAFCCQLGVGRLAPESRRTGCSLLLQECFVSQHHWPVLNQKHVLIVLLQLIISVMVPQIAFTGSWVPRGAFFQNCPQCKGGRSGLISWTHSKNIFCPFLVLKSFVWYSRGFKCTVSCLVWIPHFVFAAFCLFATLF